MKRFALLACVIGLISLGSGCCCHNWGGGQCGGCGPAGCGVGQTHPYGTAFGSSGVVVASTSTPVAH